METLYIVVTSFIISVGFMLIGVMIGADHEKKRYTQHRKKQEDIIASLQKGTLNLQVKQLQAEIKVRDNQRIILRKRIDMLAKINDKYLEIIFEAKKQGFSTDDMTPPGSYPGKIPYINPKQ